MRTMLVGVGVVVVALALLLGVMPAIAQEAGHGRDTAPVGTHEAAASTAAEPQPRVPEDPRGWAGPMLIIIAGMFIAAAVIGPIVRSEAPEEVPVPHGHGEVVGHEDHGAHEPGHHGH